MPRTRLEEVGLEVGNFKLVVLGARVGVVDGNEVGRGVGSEVLRTGIDDGTACEGQAEGDDALGNDGTFVASICPKVGCEVCDTDGEAEGLTVVPFDGNADG